MNPFTQKTWVLDGGFATELEKKGFDVKQKLWSARALKEAPQLVTEVHHDFLRAGAEIILTATYQASRVGFQSELGLSVAEIEELYRLSLKLAWQAVEKQRQADKLKVARLKENKNQPSEPRYLVGASIGPYGAMLADGSEYTGAYDLNDEVKNYYEKKIHSLMNSTIERPADFLAFETIPTLKEALLICDVLKKFPDARAWISFSRLDQPELLKKIESNSQIWAIGVNCMGPQEVSPLLRKMKSVSLPKVVYPNAGGVYSAISQEWVEVDCAPGKDHSAMSGVLTSDEKRNADSNTSELSVHVHDWISLGARVIGGCCRVGPKEIAELRKIIANSIG